MEGVTQYDLFQWRDGETFARYVGTYDEATARRLAWEYSVLGTEYRRSAFLPTTYRPRLPVAALK